MDEARARSELSFGRAYKLLESWVLADFRETARSAMTTAFGASPEFDLVEVLARAEEPLRLSEISARSGATRRAMSPPGLLRRTLERMERAGMVNNVGSARRPLYQINLLKDESKLLVLLFESNSSPNNLALSPQGP
jgi:hypothetical protein